jgi:PelA/Pel-15E family pectate lyase
MNRGGWPILTGGMQVMTRLALRGVLVHAMVVFSALTTSAQTTRPTTRQFPLTIARVVTFNDQRLGSEQGRQIVSNILTWQNRNGGWWKGYDLTAPRPTTVPAQTPESLARDGSWLGGSTIDNSATYSEMRILAHAYRLDARPEYKTAFERGLTFLLDMQYPHGGFPQRFPLQPDNYSRHITFNDNAMGSVLGMLNEIAEAQGDLNFTDEATRRRCKEAYQRGIECILKCQIKVDGRLTAWCAQHDEVTFLPAGARTYELPSISGSESAGVAMLLMEIKNPDERVKQAVIASVGWFNDAAVRGKVFRNVRGQQYERGQDRVIVDDPTAPPQWARFYDLQTNLPFYCGRDGVKKATLAEIEWERRNGYQWMRPWGQPVLDRYPAWAREHGLPEKLPTTRPAS